MAVRFAFGDFVVDTGRHSVRRGRGEIAIGERSFRVLRLLIENHGQVVGRKQLMDEAWDDVAVSDDSLARAISDLRSALGDDAANPRYIRTLHRQGYLFVAPVTVVDDPAPEEGGAARRSRRNLGLAAGLALAALIAVAGWLVLRPIERSPEVGSKTDQPDFASWKLRALGPAPFTASAIKPAFSRTGNLLAVVAPDPETREHSIFLLRPDGGQPLQLTHGIEVRGPSPEFAAGDSHILFTTFRTDPEHGQVPEVWQVPVPAGEPTMLIQNASAASSSPDGRDLVYAAVNRRGTSIRVRRGDGTELEVARHGFWPRWSPDGRWIAYTTSDPEGGEGTLHVVRPGGTEDRELTTGPSQHYGLCWTPDSSRVIFSSEEGGPTSLWSVHVSGGGLRSVTRGPGVCSTPTISADGTRLVFSFSHRRWILRLADRASAPTRHIAEMPGLRDAALSADGRRIALALGTAAQSPAVSILDTTTGERQTISGMGASDVAWMADGGSVVVAAPSPDGRLQWVWRLPIGGGLPATVLAGERSMRRPRPSPDGSSLAVVADAEGSMELFVRNLEHGTERVIACSPEIESPSWSPDGAWLAWSGGRRPEDTESGGIWICEVDGGQPQRLTRDGAWPVWQPGGDTLLYGRFLEHRGIWRVPRGGGAPQLVRALDPEMEDLYLEDLDGGRSGLPLLLVLSKFSGELYVLEPPD